MIWLHFLKNEEIPDNPKAKGLLKAKEELDYLKMDEKEQLQYNKYKEDRHHEASIYESTYVIGEKMGAKKNTIEIALKSLEQGLDKKTIKLITGLTDMELANLTNQRN